MQSMFNQAETNGHLMSCISLVLIDLHREPSKHGVLQCTLFLITHKQVITSWSDLDLVCLISHSSCAKEFEKEKKKEKKIDLDAK